MLKKLLLASTLLVAGSVTSLAADLPARGAAKAPVPAISMTDWSGMYVGGQLGISQGEIKPSAAILADGGSIRDNGAIGGLYVGNNWNFNSLVVGLELDGNLSGVSKTVTELAGTQLLGSVRGRTPYEIGLVGKLGFTADRALFYVLGGASVTNYSVRYETLLLTDTLSDTLVGWTVGAGVAYKVSSNWSGRIEYRYSDYGSKTQAMGAFDVTHGVTTQRVMAGVTYHFGGSSAPAKR
jgi:outer membrane immunogenic protein